MSASRAGLADLILTGGQIYTVDEERRWASAVAIKAGRITAVGSDSEVRQRAGDETEIVDLDGRMAMPGVIDIHNHHMMGGRADLYELKFPAAAALEQIVDAVRGAVEDTKAGEWIIGSQWGSNRGSTLNTGEALAALDSVSPKNPVMLRDDTCHNRWVNSRALAAADLTRETPDPENGSFGRDPHSGELTGMLIERAAAPVERAALESGIFSEEGYRAAAARAVAILNSLGVTGFVDAAAMLPTLEALKGLDDRGELTAWAVAAMPAVEPSFLFGIAGDELMAKRETYRSAHFKPDFVKVFLDGVPPAKTAAFVEPYQADPILGCCFRGETQMSVPELIRWIGKCEKQGLAVKIHCAGDAAVRQALDAIEVVRTFNGSTHLIHHIAHASYIQPDDIPRFAELGVAGDLSPIIWYPTPILEGAKAALGIERALQFWPNRDLHEAGALLAAGSDWPVVPNPDPWDGIEGMITRQNPAGDYPGESLWPEQALDLPTVLEIYTRNAAKAAGLGNITGSIEVGKSADILVLDRNLFQIPAHEIAETQVLTTYFEGRAVYERG
ncbi:MAG TPA: amidohydrolase [Gammaproteobacteria bacterium]|nr:amidohydrolase [Gammaproteobacteria bacterium]